MSSLISDVTACLIAAFGKQSEYKLNKLSSSELTVLRKFIASLDIESVKKYLPVILLDILENEAAEQNQYDDLVIYFLDGEKASETDVNARKTLQKLSEQTFASFTQKEAVAIVKWLIAIKNRDFIDLCHDEFTSAEKYWKKKATQGK